MSLQMCWFCQLQPVCINDVQPEPLWCPSSKDHPGFRPQQQHPTSTVLGPVEWSGCFTVSLGSGFPCPQVPSCLAGWWEGWGCQGVQGPASRKPRVPGGKSPPFKTSCKYFIRRETVTFTHLVDVVCGDFELNLRASSQLPEMSLDRRKHFNHPGSAALEWLRRNHSDAAKSDCEGGKHERISSPDFR